VACSLLYETMPEPEAIPDAPETNGLVLERA
jgi:hypothetical protein